MATKPKPMAKSAAALEMSPTPPEMSGPGTAYAFSAAATRAPSMKMMIGFGTSVIGYGCFFIASAILSKRFFSPLNCTYEKSSFDFVSHAARSFHQNFEQADDGESGNSSTADLAANRMGSEVFPMRALSSSGLAKEEGSAEYRSKISAILRHSVRNEGWMSKQAGALRILERYTALSTTHSAFEQCASENFENRTSFLPRHSLRVSSKRNFEHSWIFPEADSWSRDSVSQRFPKGPSADFQNEAQAPSSSF